MDQYRRTIDGRLRIFGTLAIFMTFGLIWRLINIQVFQHSHYLALAQGQQRFEKTEMASRGQILVHDSAVDPNVYYPLAFDVKKFAVWVVPREVKDKEGTAVALAQLTGVSKDEIYNKINNDKVYIPPIQRSLSLDNGNKIKGLKLPGIYVMPEYSRFYPEGTLASQVLGFVNSEGEGNYGFEGFFNDELKGKEGNVVGEKDTLGRIISLLEQTDPQDGTSYVLTIDRSVQYYVESKLKQALVDYQAEGGSIVIMDVKTGGILAMASTPTYDPNDYKQQAGLDPALFNNPAISYLFEPGSIFKPIIMACALDQGVVTPDTTNYFDATVNVQGYTIHTAEDKAFGVETMTQVLENSDNVGMVWVANKLSNSQLYDHIQNFGFFDKTGINLQGEASGQVPALKNWRDINRATISFGQGISVTPIELVAAYAAIANGGKYVYPHIVDKVLLPNGTNKQMAKEEGSQVISKQTADEMKEMLYNVVMHGTAKKAQVPGFKMAAKTGTAQIPDPEGKGYLDDDSKLGIYNHSAAGFAPVDDPQYAMLVKLTKPKTSKYAESTAVPVFGDISSFLLNYHYRLKPTEPIN